MTNLNTKENLLKHHFYIDVPNIGNEFILVDVNLEFRAKSKNLSVVMAIFGLIENMDKDEFLTKWVCPKIKGIVEIAGYSITSLQRYSVGPYRPMSEAQIDVLYTEMKSILSSRGIPPNGKTVVNGLTI